LVRNRIGDIKLISNATIGKIYGMCSESPRTFLKNCEDVCRHVVDNGHKRVTKRNIREALRRYMDLDL